MATAGLDDHSDGIVRCFWNNHVIGVDGVESHVAWNSDDKKVYVADTGHKRILVLDPALGRTTAPMQGMEKVIRIDP
jgi:DNA-binding beta-propeller fold protein YncE